MSVLALSGWGQPHDALSAIAPDALHVNYAKCETIESALEEISAVGKNADTVIGWSLGGQLAVRAVAMGLIEPKYLVLIAAPFQFVWQPDLPIGMKRDLYDTFRENYGKNPLRTLTKSWELIAHGDRNADTLRGYMAKMDKHAVLQYNWLHWLEIMEDFSCAGLDFSRFPKTLIVQGGQDAIVYPNQSQEFARRIPGAELVIIEGCGHAPHWHDCARMKRYANV